ncbi:hypothetical protein OIU79_010120 [Salix purpurea]|uniref:Secreted protein n=1 Tax=Salix purpurea TaxID=77065 RepID=A0A9Q0QEU7_SALPP|nr:hypothetical protein OIU79_010120 [Salix purpurea]
MPARACSSSFIALLVLLPEQDMAYCHEPNWVQLRLAFSSVLSNPEASVFSSICLGIPCGGLGALRLLAEDPALDSPVWLDPKQHLRIFH